MRRLAIVLAALLVCAGCATTEPVPRVSKEDIVELARAGADARWIIDRLVETGTVLRLSASELVELHAQGVPQEVLDWMQAAQIQDIRRRDALLHGSPFGPCPWPPRPAFHPLYGWRFSPWPCW